MKRLFAALAPLLSIAIFLIAPLPISPDLDFGQFHVSLVGILSGDRIYDEQAHAAHYFNDHWQNIILPPAYPAWYYVTMLPLGLAGPANAARVWAVLNLLMLVAAVELILGNQDKMTRFLALGAAVLFGPVLGHIVVGQQSLIVLLGAAIVLHAYSIQSGRLFGLGACLLTFKPHLGIPLLLAAYGRLFQESSHLLKSAVVTLLSGMTILSLLCLAIDPTSLSSYPDSLRRLGALPVNRICDSCSSLSIILERDILGGVMSSWLVRIASALILVTLFVVPAKIKHLEFSKYMGAVTAILLLVSPYLRNYDYSLLILPMVVWLRTARRAASAGEILLISSSWLFTGLGSLMLDRESQGMYLWIGAVPLYILMIRRSRENV